MVWERVGVQSRARDRREWALTVGWKYLAKAGQVRQVASHYLPKLLPTSPEGAQDKAREQRGRGKLKQGPPHSVCLHAQQAEEGEMHLSEADPPSNPGEAQPWETKPHLLLLLLPSQTSKRG